MSKEEFVNTVIGNQEPSLDLLASCDLMKVFPEGSVLIYLRWMEAGEK